MEKQNYFLQSQDREMPGALPEFASLHGWHNHNIIRRQ